MKRPFKILLLSFALMFSLAAFSQGGKDEVEKVRVSFINKKLELSNSESEKFWPLYNEYNDKIKALRRNLRQSIKKAPENLSDKEAEELYQLDLKTRQAEADVHKTYSEKIKAVIGAKKMVMLRAAEEEFKQKMLDSIKGKDN